MRVRSTPHTRNSAVRRSNFAALRGRPFWLALTELEREGDRSPDLVQLATSLAATLDRQRSENRPILPCFPGRVGWRVLEYLQAAGLPTVVIDVNCSAQDPRLKDAQLVRGDIREAEVLEQACVRNARGVLIMTKDDLTNIGAALMVRHLNADVRIVMRLFNQNLVTRLGKAFHDIFALSTSDLTAPLFALTALTGQALYTCAPRSSRELETYSVTGWVRYLEKHESDGDWHLELTRGSDSPRDSCLVVEIPPTLPDGLYGLARADLDRLLAGAPVTAAGEVTAPVRLRVIGPAFFDGEHRGGPDRRDQTDGSHGHCNLSARALWEIHPVYWVRPP